MQVYKSVYDAFFLVYVCVVGTFPLAPKAVNLIQLATQTATVPIQHPGQSAQICRKTEWTLPTTEPQETRFFPLQTRSLRYRDLNWN